MFCKYCGSVINDGARFCSACGKEINGEYQQPDNCLYELESSESRTYSLRIYRDRVLIDGNYSYLINKEYISTSGEDVGMLSQYLGTDIIKKGSYKKTVIYVFAGLFLELFNTFLGYLNDAVNRVNNVLKYLDRQIQTPPVFNIILNILIVICILLAINGLSSIKKMIVISFKDKRFCIPAKSVTQTEYSTILNMLHSLAKEQR